MFAALPMYDLPGLRADTDALWEAIRDCLRADGLAAPDILTYADDLRAQWLSPDLLLGQTCGLPFRTELHHQVTLLGAFDFGLEDTPPGFYHSVFVARADDPRDGVADFGGARLAFSDAQSQSGWAVATTAPVRFTLGPRTGSHRASLDAVATGVAEITAVDAVTWRLLDAQGGLPHGLKPVGRSETTPGLPLITAFPGHADRLRAAIAMGIGDLTASQRVRLGLRSLVDIPPAAYLAVPIPPSPKAYAAAAA